jgi:L,D-transpeptidase YcbB
MSFPIQVRCFLLILVVSCAACSNFKNPAVSEARLWSQHFDSTVMSGTELTARLATTTFYKRNNFQIVWSDTGGVNDRADSMIYTIRSAEMYGLLPGDYHLVEINSLLSLPRSHDRAVSLDLYLTDAFFTYVSHLKNGRIEKDTLARILQVSHNDVAAQESLDAVLSGNSLAGELKLYEPSSAQYQVMRSWLRKMLRGPHGDTLSLSRIKKLTMNMERVRWRKLSMPRRYLSVNVPAFQLKVVENDTVVVDSRVIIGKTETPTPEMESVIRSFIIYPYWHVPRSIVKEILPHIQEDTVFLKSHNYDVLDQHGKTVRISSIDWWSYDAETFPYVLRQREGSENTMGVIKFVFANNYGVYLHDTNARGLFRREERALSHGCIRVQKAVDLARYMIKNDYVVSPEDLDQYMQLQHRMEIKLIEPIPIYLQYFTCEAKDGKVFFYDDIYGKDKLLCSVLNGESKPVL